MSRIYVRMRKDAEAVADVMTDLHGVQPSVFRDGNGYVVQHNDLSQEAVERALFDRGLPHLLDQEAVRRIVWEKSMGR